MSGTLRPSGTMPSGTVVYGTNYQPSGGTKLSGTYYLPSGTTTVSLSTALSPDMWGTIQPSGTT